MKDLEDIRKEIDQIDGQLLELLEKRMNCAKLVGQYKQAHNLPVFVPEREQEVIDERLKNLKNPENVLAADRFFHLLMDLSKEEQKKIVQEKKTASPVLTDKLVAYQGVEGANQEQATIDYFGEEVRRLPCESFADVFQAVEAGRASYGVIPIENSTAGSVFEIYDLLGETGCFIVGEQNVSIHHDLMAKPGTEIGMIRKVYSHPQALQQCRYFLSQQNWQEIAYSNTAAAAKMVHESREMDIAAIAAPRAASVHHLQILESDIQDRFDNITRFVVIAAQPEKITGVGKVSIMFTLRHKSGTLYNVLEHFAKAKLNLTKIESRVIPSRSFEYRFYMDFEGDLNPDSVDKTIAELFSVTQEVTVLGAYLSDAQRRK